jgi:hypothetical protein
VTDLAPIPLALRTHLTHATLQAIADVCGADILHIKGAAVHASLDPSLDGTPANAYAQNGTPSRLSADADVLVRPGHLRGFLATMKQYGWLAVTRFDTGGGADHSTDLWHAELGWADVHRSFPGIRLDAALAFHRLWLDRRFQPIAHRPCAVPSVDAQRLILLLHAARNGQSRKEDVRNCWTNASLVERSRVTILAKELRAEVPLASVTGRLGDFTDRPEYDLWRLYAVDDASRFEMWRARMKAAQTGLDRLLALINPLRLKADGLSLQLGRTPTAREVTHYYYCRLLSDLVDIKTHSSQQAVRRAKRSRSRW